jgi:hypothetical protein
MRTRILLLIKVRWISEHTLQGSILSLQISICGRPWPSMALFWAFTVKLMNADPAFHSNPDPDPYQYLVRHGVEKGKKIRKRRTAVQCCGSGSNWKVGSESVSASNWKVGSGSAPTSKWKSWIRIRISLKVKSQIKWNMSLFEHFLRFSAVIWKLGSGSAWKWQNRIRIRIQLMRIRSLYCTLQLKYKKNYVLINWTKINPKVYQYDPYKAILLED